MVLYLSSCKKDPPVYGCNISGDTDTALTGLSKGSILSNSYRYDNYGRLIEENNFPITYGNGFVAFPDPAMGPPDTAYLNAAGFPVQAGGETFYYDNKYHLIKVVFYSGGYKVFNWQNGDNVSVIGYDSSGNTTGAETYYTYYNNIPYQSTQPGYLHMGEPSAHMLQNEKDIFNYNDVLGSYTYTYSFDKAGRVSGYMLYDGGDVWVTDLAYSCPD